jgi:hypothetical protein
MWGIGKSSVNREQCNAPEDLLLQAKAAWTNITMLFVNGRVESHFTGLCTVLLLRGQS